MRKTRVETECYFRVSYINTNIASVIFHSKIVQRPTFSYFSQNRNHKINNITCFKIKHGMKTFPENI